MEKGVIGFGESVKRGWKCGTVPIVILAFLSAITAEGSPYEEMVPLSDRSKSRVVIRKITCPTAANLDFAAYDRNPLLFDRPQKKPSRVPLPRTVKDLTFGGALEYPVGDLNATPVSEPEKDRPFAWKPFIKRSWEVVKDEGLQRIAGRINGYKWEDPEVFQPYQELTTLHIHHGEGGVELWVKVEFPPWVTFLKDIPDADEDGFHEIYGKLNTRSVNPDSLAKIVSWAMNDYAADVLSEQQTLDWVTDLASYWYPTRNTDILDPATDGKWPDARTGKKIVRQLRGVKVTRPLAVIEGKPFSPKDAVYNVFIVDAETGAAERRVKRKAPGTAMPPKVIDMVLSDNFRNNNLTFSNEISRFGSYRIWEEANLPFFDGVRRWIHGFPGEQMGLEGKDGWLFFRKSIDYMLGGDVSLQMETTNPLPHIVMFRNYLVDLGIDMLFVAVPNKEEIYYDNMSDSIPLPEIPVVNPYGRKILADLQQAGVEVVDLLPAFLDAKKEDSAAGDFVYQRYDTHWSGRGVEIAGEMISDRIRAYPWYQAYRDTVSYNARDTIIIRTGDLSERLPQDRQASYKPQQLRVRRVFEPSGDPYWGNHYAAPVLLIGDSFTGVFEFVDCKSAGIGSCMAYKCRVPVDIVTSWGGGPMVRQKMLRTRGAYLDQKRVVVYMMVARDLFGYPQGWEPLRSGDR